MEQIVCGVDGSEAAAEALRWAIEEAKRRGAEVTAVLSGGFLDEHQMVVGTSSEILWDEDDAHRVLDGFIADALGGEWATIGRRIVLDLPGRSLVEASRDASLLVVGTRGLGGFRGLLVGSVSEYCLHHSQVPVAVVRSRMGATPGATPRVVVGIDGSATAQRAFRWAIEAARLRDAELDVVHTWSMPYAGGHPFTSSTPLGLDRLQDAAEETISSALAHEQEALQGLHGQVRPIVRCGGAAGAILEVAAGAQLVVVGSRGRGNVQSALLGSVSRQVVHHVECPIVVVPPNRHAAG